MLLIEINNKQIYFSPSQVRTYSGIENIDDSTCENYKKLKKYLIKVIEESRFNKNVNDKINFDSKKIYNHILFYSYLKIILDIVPEKINSDYKTFVKYKDKIIYSPAKTLEVYFNFKIIRLLKQNDKFSYLFDNDNKLFNSDKIIIDLPDDNVVIKDRLDMKIKINDDVHYGLELFEKGHIKKYDPNFIQEHIRIFSKMMYVPKVKFVVVFWYDDLFDKKIFNRKFNIIIEQFDKYSKTNRDYCIDNLNKVIINKPKLCEIIYDSYKNKNNAIINIDVINSLFVFNKNKEKKYLKLFISKITKKIKEDYKSFNDKDIEFLEDEENDEDDEDEDDEVNELNEEDKDEDQYISDQCKKYFIDDKLTYDGLIHYILGLNADNYLKYEKEKFGINDWIKNITSAFIDGLEEYNDNLKNDGIFNRIFGISN